MRSNKLIKMMLSACIILPTMFPVVPIVAKESKAETIVYEQEAKPSRSEINFNTDWRYFKGNKVDAFKENYNDQSWVYVNLPHTSTYYTPDNKDAYKGVNWYRKTFKLDKSMESKQLLLTFEAAMQKSEVWLNGELVLTHKGGYTPFVIDLTGKLNYDNDNVIAVKVDGKADPTFAPGADRVDFQYFGAMYGNAYITVKDPIHITDAIEANTVAGGGVFVTTPEVNKDSATVKVKTQVENNSNTKKDVSLITQVLDQSDEIVVERTSQNLVEASARTEFIEEMMIENPRLWSVETPELYTVRTIVEVDGKETDREDTTYGLRKVDWKREGLYINDELTPVDGMNLHGETYMLGNAIPNNAIDGIIKRLKENGIDFIRMAHYPHLKAFYEACDKYGVMVLECSSGWQNYADTDEFKQSTYNELRTIIRGHRNHPSIVAWEPSLNESGYTDAWAYEMNRITKEEYPEDGEAYAWTSGWKSWDAWDIALGTPQADVFKSDSPTGGAGTDKPVIVSEYGDWSYGGNNSTTRVTRHQATDKFNYGIKGGDEGMLIAADNAQESVNLMNGKGYVAASMYWDYADYAGFESQKLTYCGIVDVYGIEKHGAYFYRSQLDPKRDMSKYGINSGGAMVYIANLWDGKYDNGEVRVYSNCDTVKLYKGDVLVGEQGHDETIWGPHGDDELQNNYPTSTSGKDVSAKNLKYAPITFKVGDFEPGELTAVGVIDGKEVAQDIRKTPEPASKVTLDPENEDALALNGSDAKLVFINIEDAQGTIATDSFDDVNLEITGPGIIVGPKTISARGGQVAVWVKGIRGEGEITLNAKVAGLKSDSITIATKKVDNLPKVPVGGDCDEYEFEATVETNVFLNKKVTASSENVVPGAKDENKDNAVDGDYNTKWCASSGTHPQWLQVDLGSKMSLDTLQLDLETTNKTYYYTIAVADEEITDKNVNNYIIKDFSESGTNETAFALENIKGRYVRIDFVKAVGEWAVIREISGTGTSSNIALNKATLASSENVALNNQIEAAKYAVDGNLETKWCADARREENHWWQVDLGDTYEVSDINAVFEFNDAAYKFVLQGSIDGINFFDIEDYRNSEGFGKETTIGVDQVVRYVRFYDITTNDLKTKWPVICEVSMQGEKVDYKPIEVSRDKPMSASSCKDGTTPEMGSDGKPGSFWIPGNNDKKAWWCVDTQGIYQLDSIVMTWNTQEEHKYLIEGSIDGENWTTIIDHSINGTTELVPVEVVRGAARYIRVTLPANRPSDQGFGLFKVNGLTAEPRLIKQIGTLDSVEITAGTEFEKFGLPSEVMVELENGMRTKLPIEWNKDTFVVNPPDEAANEASAAVKGKVTALPGVVVTEDNSEIDLLMTVIRQDTSLLEAIIDTANKINLDDIPADQKEIFTQTLADAKTIVEKANAFDFEATAECLEQTKGALIKVLNDLGFIVADRNDLDKLVIIALDIDLSEYLLDGQEEFKEALASAQAVLNNPDSSDSDIYSAWEQLNTSIEGLKKLPNKNELETLIKSAELILNDENKYTEDSFKKLTDTLIKAKEVLSNSEATQSLVDDTKEDLQKAIDNLELIAVDPNKVALAIAIEMAGTVTPEQIDKLVPAVANEFKTALENANTVFDNDAATQDEINLAFDRLAKVMQMLEFYKGDKALLLDLLADIANLEESKDKYSKDSWDALQAVLPSVNAVAIDENAMQKEVDEAFSKLVTAYLNLRLIPNKDALAGLIKDAEGLKAGNYSVASWNAVQEALKEAKGVLDNPDATVVEVNNANEALTKAIAGLVANPVISVDPNTVKQGDTTVNAIKTGDTVNIMYSVVGLAIASLGFYVNKKRRKYN